MFDGKTFTGWEGEVAKTWRIEDGSLMAGSLVKGQPKNEFLATSKEYQNFDLRLKWKLEGSKGFVNGGVQFRTKRIPNSNEVRGYQADLGAGYDGMLYDESGRGILVDPSKEIKAKAGKPLGQWNDYRIRCEGPHIQIWLNGIQTVDYTEKDPKIPLKGIIAVQIHSNEEPGTIVAYKDISIQELPVE